MTPLSILEGIFLILSNLFLLPAILYAYELGDWPEFHILFNLMKVSAAYHTCQANFFCFWFDIKILQLADHFTVYITLFWIALYFTGTKLDTRFSIWIGLILLLFPCLLVYEDNIWLPISLICVLIPMVIFLFWWSKDGIKEFRIVNILIGTVLLASGFFLYVMGGDPIGHVYAWTHIFWHIFSMLSIYFIIDIRNGNNTINRLIRVCCKYDPTISIQEGMGFVINLKRFSKEKRKKNVKQKVKGKILTLNGEGVSNIFDA